MFCVDHAQNAIDVYFDGRKATMEEHYIVVRTKSGIGYQTFCKKLRRSRSTSTLKWDVSSNTSGLYRITVNDTVTLELMNSFLKRQRDIEVVAIDAPYDM